MFAITTFNKEGYDLYGKRFVRTFTDNSSIPLIVYIEGEFEVEDLRFSDSIRDLHGSSEELVKFKDRHKDYKESGLDSPKKFANKVFAQYHAMKHAPVFEDRLFWFDADIVVKQPLTLRFFESFMPKKHLLSYLGREYMSLHTETGFLGFNLKHSYIHMFFDYYIKMYITDAIMTLGECHDCMAFDIARKRIEMLSVKTYNISKECKTGHPMDESRLGEFLSHLKGANRKRIGYNEQRQRFGRTD
jgi:hypothetical protein